MKMKEKVVKAIKNNDSSITAKDGLLLCDFPLDSDSVSVLQQVRNFNMGNSFPKLYLATLVFCGFYISILTCNLKNKLWVQIQFPSF